MVRCRNCGGRFFKIKNGRQRAEGEPVALTEDAALHALAIDESARGGVEIENFITAVRILSYFGVLFGEALIIDNHVIALAPADGKAVCEGSHHFLSVFECEGEFCHDFFSRLSVQAMSMM